MSAQTAGYSATPLAKKLGLKPGQSVAFIGLPDALAYLKAAEEFAYLETIEDWQKLSARDLDFVQYFTKSEASLRAALPVLKHHIKPAGMIWVSWPKKVSKVPTDVTEDVIRKYALADVLVDVKVCAVDLIWSGLKLVIRKELRASMV